MINSYLFEGYKAVATLYNFGKVGAETLIVNTQHTPVFGLPNGVKDRKESRIFLLCFNFPKRKLKRVVEEFSDYVIVDIFRSEDIPLIKRTLKKLFPKAKIKVLDFFSLRKVINGYFDNRYCSRISRRSKKLIPN